MIEMDRALFFSLFSLLLARKKESAYERKRIKRNVARSLHEIINLPLLRLVHFPFAILSLSAFFISLAYLFLY